jgi:hypothetical protein
MKLSQLKPCRDCGGPLGQIFYVMRWSMALVSPQAARGVLGTAMAMGAPLSYGSLQVAEALAPDAEAVKIAGDEMPEGWTSVNVCQDCWIKRVGDLAERSEN